MLTFKSKDFFFDRPAVMKVIADKNKSALSRAGGMTRRVSRQSIKYRKKRTIKSKPGEPPIAHTKNVGIRTIFYAYDPTAESVVCGAVRLGGTKRPDVPNVLEMGGQSLMRVTPVKVSKPKGRRVSNRSRSASELNRIRQHYVAKRAAEKARMITVTIKARPFMGPALDKVRDQLPGLWG